MDKWKQETFLELNSTVFIANFPETIEGMNETLTIPHDQFDPRWHRPRIHRLSHPKRKIILLKQLAETGTTQLPCSKLKMVKPGQKRQKWEQEQNTMKTTRRKKMMAARTNIDVTSFHFLLSIARPFEKRFREVFGNARILNFYLSIRAWEEKSLPESYLGCFYIVFGEGKATKETMSIFWFIWPLSLSSKTQDF